LLFCFFAFFDVFGWPVGVVKLGSLRSVGIFFI
jgi:hypothetical protein